MLWSRYRQRRASSFPSIGESRSVLCSCGRVCLSASVFVTSTATATATVSNNVCRPSALMLHVDGSERSRVVAVARSPVPCFVRVTNTHMRAVLVSAVSGFFVVFRCLVPAGGLAENLSRFG